MAARTTRRQPASSSSRSCRLRRPRSPCSWWRRPWNSIATTLFQNGEQRATRLDDETAPAWEPTAADLADFEGRYFSEELETFYTIVLETPPAEDAEPAGDTGSLEEEDEAETLPFIGTARTSEEPSALARSTS